MGRQFVHLSADCQTAVAVGLRKSTDPVVLLVNSQEAWNAGIAFYRGNLHVWLADRVPAAYIQFGRRSPDAA